MSEFPRLTKREWEVLELLLQGKSNKLIAYSLGISERTVEFHLKNIYAKFQVSSRIELFLMLGKATGWFEAEKLGHSTVAGKGESAENRDRLNLRMSWAKPFRETDSIIGEESEMKNLISNPIFASILTTLLTGWLWVATLIYSGHLSAEDFKVFTIPLIIILAIGGLLVGAIGKQRGETLPMILFSAVCGTGLSPFAVIPLMRFVVLPIGKLVANLGAFDPSAIPAETASMIAMGIMITLWLIAGATLGIGLLILFGKLQPTNNHGQAEGIA